MRSNHGLDKRIREIFAEYRQSSGEPRVAKTLHNEGLICSESRVARRMRALGLQAIEVKNVKPRPTQS